MFSRNVCVFMYWFRMLMIETNQTMHYLNWRTEKCCACASSFTTHTHPFVSRIHMHTPNALIHKVRVSNLNPEWNIHQTEHTTEKKFNKHTYNIDSEMKETLVLYAFRHLHLCTKWRCLHQRLTEIATWSIQIRWHFIWFVHYSIKMNQSNVWAEMFESKMVHST